MNEKKICYHCFGEIKNRHVNSIETSPACQLCSEIYHDIRKYKSLGAKTIVLFLQMRLKARKRLGDLRRYNSRS